MAVELQLRRYARLQRQGKARRWRWRRCARLNCAVVRASPTSASFRPVVRRCVAGPKVLCQVCLQLLLRPPAATGAQATARSHVMGRFLRRVS